MTIVYHGVYLLFLLAGNDCNVNPYGTLLKPSMVEAVSTRSGVQVVQQAGGNILAHMYPYSHRSTKISRIVIISVLTDADAQCACRVCTLQSSRLFQ